MCKIYVSRQYYYFVGVLSEALSSIGAELDSVTKLDNLSWPEFSSNSSA